MAKANTETPALMNHVATALRETAAVMKSHHGTTDWNDQATKGFASRVIDGLMARADELDPPPPAPVAAPATETAAETSE
jgi:hypothetical protein